MNEAERRIAALEAELERVRRTNDVLMQRVEHRISQEGNAFAAFQAAINLEKTVAARTAELREVNERLAHELDLRRKFEAALLRAKEQAEEATRSKTRFVAAASHDLRQPLNAAILYLESIASVALGARDADSLRGARLALATLNTLLATLLDISRLDSGTLHPRPTHLALAPVLERLAHEYGALAGRGRLRLRVVPRQLAVHTDPALLETVLRNLLSNAVKYARGARILLAARSRGEVVRVQVSDTGPGIAPCHAEHIFEEFWRAPDAGTRDAGIGLGLAIVDRISRLLGTTVQLASSPGRGASFSLVLPRSRVVLFDPAALQPATDALTGFAGRCVALVDDNRTVLHSLERLLSGWECHTVVGGSVEEVLTKLIDTDRVPDLVIADYHLGGERNGLDAIAEIAAEFPRPVPGIVVSSDTSSGLAESLRARDVPLLTKPLEVARLRALMKHLLRTS